MITTESQSARHEDVFGLRHHEDRGRIPFQIPVELAHQDFADDAFEADGVDLSSGGIALRSACLPDIGEQLSCRFEAMPGGMCIESRGEVVWTHAEGERSGEFGLRFLDVDSQTRALIDELVAERKAQHDARTTHGSQSSPEMHSDSASFDEMRIAELEIAGVAAPLSARLLRAGGGEAVFEQRMDLLELGRDVIARAGSALGKGSISDVTLRMDGETPTLAVTVRFDQGKSLFGEFDWETQPAQAPESDTVPDLDAPSETPASVRAHTTMMEFEVAREPAQQAAHVVIEADALPAVLADAEVDVHVERPAAVAEPAGVIAREASEPQAPVQASAPAPRITRAEPAPRIDHDDEWAHPVPDAARTSALVRFLRILVAVASAIQTGGKVVWTKLWPQTQALSSSVGGSIGKLSAGAVPMARDLVQGMFSKATARPRRTTTAPVAQLKTEQEGRGIVRLAVISVLGVCAIALGVYALAPSGSDDAISVHRKGKHAPAKAAATSARSESEAAPAAEPVAAAAPGAVQPSAATPAAPVAATTNAAYASAMTGQPVAQPTAAAPAAGTVPASSPYAVDVRDAAHPAAAAAKPATVPAAVAKPAVSTANSNTAGPSFGAKNPGNAQRFTLRMSGPVKTLQGSSDRTGFTVTIPGVRSLDRASPIAANHKAVARAMVLNKADHAELSVVFKSGKSPAFRVVGHGAELEVLIAQ